MTPPLHVSPLHTLHCASHRVLSADPLTTCPVCQRPVTRTAAATFALAPTIARLRKARAAARERARKQKQKRQAQTGQPAL